MKKILEAILAINLAVLSCIVFINIILRYGFQTSILSVDELSRYLFVWLTFIGAIVAFMDNAHVQVTFWWRNSPRMATTSRSGYPFLNLIYLWRTGLGATLKTIQDWSDYSPILGLPIGLMYAACLPTSLVIAFFELRHLYQLITRSNSLTSPPQGA